MFKAVVGHKVVLADHRDFEFCAIYDGSLQVLDLLCVCTMSVGFLSCKMTAEFILMLLKCSRESRQKLESSDFSTSFAGSSSAQKPED